MAIELFNSFLADAMNGSHDLSSDGLYVMLSNVAPVAGNTVVGDITEIAPGNGYTAGGQALANVSSAQVDGVYSLSADDLRFTASGGTMATFRYGVLYNLVNSRLIGYWDKGSSRDIPDGDIFDFDFEDGNILVIQAA